MSTPPTSPPAKGDSLIVCHLNAWPPSARDAHGALTSRVIAAITAVEDVDEGYKILLDPTLALSDVAQWVDVERQCCPFLDFQIRVERDSGERSLQLTGPPGVKEFLAAQFLKAQPGTP